MKFFFSLSFNECGYAHLLGRLACSIKRSYLSTFGGGKFNLSERTFNCIMTSSSFLSPEVLSPKLPDHGSLIEWCLSPQLKGRDTFKVLYHFSMLPTRKGKLNCNCASHLIPLSSVAEKFTLLANLL